jgi:hypothetical protein
MVSLRFLRARQFDVEKALQLLKACCEKKKELEAFEWAKKPPEESAKCNIKMMKSWYPHETLGFDKANRPILFEHTGGIHPTYINYVTTHERLVSYHLWNMETHLNGQFVAALERARAKGETFDAVSTCVILDFENIGMQHFTPHMMDRLKSLIDIDNVCYPELLGKLFVLNTPWLALRMWDMCKSWLDPRTINKIEILGYGPEAWNRVKEFVDEENLPPRYGGNGPDYRIMKPLTEVLTLPQTGESIDRVVTLRENQNLVVETYLIDSSVILQVKDSIVDDEDADCIFSDVESVKKAPMRGQSLDDLHIDFAMANSTENATVRSVLEKRLTSTSPEPDRFVVNIPASEVELKEGKARLVFIRWTSQTSTGYFSSSKMFVYTMTITDA